MPTVAETAGISTVVAAVVASIPKMLAALRGGRLAARRAVLSEIQQGQVNLETAYNRLERENVRIHKRVEDLEGQLRTEQEEHAITRSTLIDLQLHCARVETACRRYGVPIPRRGARPDDVPDEEGDEG